MDIFHQNHQALSDLRFEEEDVPHGLKPTNSFNIPELSLTSAHLYSEQTDFLIYFIKKEFCSDVCLPEKEEEKVGVLKV